MMFESPLKFAMKLNLILVDVAATAMHKFCIESSNIEIVGNTPRK